MSAGWIAGATRARLLLGRRLGRDGALELAAARSQAEALAVLAASDYGRHVEPGSDLADAQRGIALTTLLRLRVLAGWAPPGSVETFRTLAGWFELANVEDRLAYLLGAELPHPFELGSLALAWPSIAPSQTPGELRERLAASGWGDPGGDEPETVHHALRIAWARRLLAEVPETSEWVAGALALLVAREVLLGDGSYRLPPDLALVLGSGWERAATPGAVASALPRDAARALEGVVEAQDLWRAEARWWTRVEHDAERMVHGHRAGRHVVVGAAALLAADARRAAVALEVAARGGPAEPEVMPGAAA